MGFNYPQTIYGIQGSSYPDLKIDFDNLKSDKFGENDNYVTINDGILRNSDPSSPASSPAFWTYSANKSEPGAFWKIREVHL